MFHCKIVLKRRDFDWQQQLNGMLASVYTSGNPTVMLVEVLSLAHGLK